MKNFILSALVIFSVSLTASPVALQSGGTGVSSTTANQVPYAGANLESLSFAGFGNTGQGLVSGGTSSVPTWQNVLPGYIAGTGFAYAGTTSTLAATANRTILISPSATYASMTLSAVDNVAMGHNALNAMTSNGQCTAVGVSALALATGANNTAVGMQAAAAITSGTDNISIGYQSGDANSTGNYNVCIGFNAGTSNTVSEVVYVGSGAGDSATTSVSNVAVGESALGTLTSGSDRNTALGSSTGPTGDDHVAVGYAAIQDNTGNQSVGLGYSAGNNATSGANNIYLGSFATPISNTESNNIIIGNSSQTAAYFFGITGQTTAGGVNVLINSSHKLGTTTSSKKYKKNIASTSDELLKKMAGLKMVQFNYKNDQTEKLQYGMIAEDVEKIFPETVVYTSDGDIYSIQYHKYVPLLIKQVQQQHQKMETLKKRALKLHQKIKKLKSMTGFYEA